MKNAAADARRVDARRVDALYGELQPQLARILAANIDAPGWLIEDACQTAWSALLLHGREVPAGAELGWLSTTAMRVALRLLRRESALSARRIDLESGAGEEQMPTEPGPEMSLELIELLSEVRRLPSRQARLLVMRGLGYECEEIAAATGHSRRTVKRQLERAREHLRLAVAG